MPQQSHICPVFSPHLKKKGDYEILPVLLLLMGEDIPPGKGMCPFWPAGDVLDEGDLSCQA